ncbi:MAG: hypothetical protein ABI885_10225 [Gammaproteobacteria bacterium]
MIDSKLTEDKNPTETKEWLDSLESVLADVGVERATFLLKQLSARNWKAPSVARDGT